MTRNNNSRRLAANEVETPEGSFVPGYVETDGGYVVASGHLDGERERTEWLGGIIKVATDDSGRLRAYHNGKPII